MQEPTFVEEQEIESLIGGQMWEPAYLPYRYLESLE
jgi:hypothetical protein